MRADIAELRQGIEINQETIADYNAQIAALGKVPVTSYPTLDALWKARLVKENLANDLNNELVKENPFETKVQTLSSTLVNLDTSKVTAAALELKHWDYLLNLLSAKNSYARKKIIEGNLSFLNARLNHYLSSIGLKHEVVFNPDMSVDILLNGREYDYGMLSRGQMNRVTLATSFAFRDVWERANDPINLLFVDELLDFGLDGAGAEASLKLLNKMAHDKKSVFLISHKEELIGRCQKILTVKMTDGFTSFEMDAAT
jgi:DNA repair exonuclease SbcCD ATPase subunit